MLLLFLSLLLITNACNAAQDQQQQDAKRQRLIMPSFIIMTKMKVSLKSKELLGKNIQLKQEVSFCKTEMEISWEDGSPLEKVWHYDKAPVLPEPKSSDKPQ